MSVLQRGVGTDGQNNTHTHTHTSSYYVHVVFSLHCAWLSQEANPNGIQLITLALIPYISCTSDGKSRVLYCQF